MNKKAKPQYIESKTNRIGNTDKSKIRIRYFDTSLSKLGVEAG